MNNNIVVLGIVLSGVASLHAINDEKTHAAVSSLCNRLGPAIEHFEGAEKKCIRERPFLKQFLASSEAQMCDKLARACKTLQQQSRSTKFYAAQGEGQNSNMTLLWRSMECFEDDMRKYKPQLLGLANTLTPIIFSENAYETTMQAHNMDFYSHIQNLIKKIDDEQEYVQLLGNRTLPRKHEIFVQKLNEQAKKSDQQERILYGQLHYTLVQLKKRMAYMHLWCYACTKSSYQNSVRFLSLYESICKKSEHKGVEVSGFPSFIHNSICDVPGSMSVYYAIDQGLLTYCQQCAYDEVCVIAEREDIDNVDWAQSIKKQNEKA